MRQIYGLAAALMVAGMMNEDFRDAPVRRQAPEEPRQKPPAPSDPVVDTTRESKRAKRRRLAKS